MLADYVKAYFNPIVQTKHEILSTIPFYSEVWNCEIIKREECYRNSNRFPHGDFWWVPLRKVVKEKPLGKGPRIVRCIKSEVNLGKIHFNCTLWVKDKWTVHHIFQSQLLCIHSDQVSLETLRLWLQTCRHCLLWRRNRVHEYYVEFWMIEKRLLLIGRWMYVTLFCQLVVYQFQRSICGSIIRKGMIFWMFAVLSHIDLLLNKPYHFPNLLSGVQTVILLPKESLWVIPRQKYFLRLMRKLFAGY